MTVYLSMLACIILIASFAKYLRIRVSVQSVGNPTRPRHSFSLFLVIAILTCVAGLRSFVGTDYYDYQMLFTAYQQIPISSIFNPSNTFDVGRAFAFTTRLIGFLGANSQWSFFIYSLFTILLMVSSLQRNSSDFLLSLFLYVASTLYFSSFNGIRQWIAAAILFWGARFLFERKILPYLLCVGVAALFHTSALLLIAAVFFVYSSRWDFRRVVMILAFALVTVFFAQSVKLTSDFLSVDPRYQLQIALNANDDGINLLRAIVESLPAVLALSLKSIRERKDTKTLVIMNMSLLNALFAILALQITVLARAFFYFAPFNLLLLPLVFENLGKYRKGVTVLAVIGYLAFMILLLPNDSNLLPYRSIFG